MDKLVEEREGFAPCPFCKQYSHSIGDDQLAAAFRHFQSMYAHPIRGTPMGDVFDQETQEAAQALMSAAAIAQKRVNELEALVEQMGGGCDANCGGLHSAMQQGREWFCPDCGLMLKRVAYVLPHVKPAVARAALPTMLKGNGDG